MTKIAVWLDTVKPGFGAAYGQVFADMGCDDESDLQYFKQAGKLTAVAGKLAATAENKDLDAMMKVKNDLKSYLEEHSAHEQDQHLHGQIEAAICAFRGHE